VATTLTMRRLGLCSIHIARPTGGMLRNLTRLGSATTEGAVLFLRDFILRPMHPVKCVQRVQLARKISHVCVSWRCACDVLDVNRGCF